MTRLEEFEQILKEANIKTEGITIETPLKAMGLDSLDLVEIVMSVEEKYGIEFSEDELTTLVTVKDFVDAIDKKAK